MLIATTAWYVPTTYLVGAAAMIGAYDTATRWRAPRLVGLLPLISLGGIYACVPETDHVRTLAPVFIAVAVAALLGWRLQPSAIAVAAGVLCWAAWFGGRYRPSGLIGGLAAVGMLVVEPIVARFPGRQLVRGVVAPVILVGLHAGYALLVARTAGLRHDTESALAISAAAAVALALVSSPFVERVCR